MLSLAYVKKVFLEILFLSHFARYYPDRHFKSYDGKPMNFFRFIRKYFYNLGEVSSFPFIAFGDEKRRERICVTHAEDSHVD
jgi:hypothetical protein